MMTLADQTVGAVGVISLFFFSHELVCLNFYQQLYFMFSNCLCSQVTLLYTPAMYKRGVVALWKTAVTLGQLLHNTLFLCFG